MLQARDLQEMTEQILEGLLLTKEQAMELVSAPLEDLCRQADALRQETQGAYFDFCTIVNGKSGRCSEDCKFCAQSSRYSRGGEGSYGLLDGESLSRLACSMAEKGIRRYSIVTSGRALPRDEVEEICRSAERIRQQAPVQLCGSFGLLEEADFLRLRRAGFCRIHNNLESSRRFFPQICQSHSYDDKLRSIRAAQNASLEVCSGGLFGMGEDWEDRIDMALELRRLQIRSVPINFLIPIPGTPLGDRPPLPQEEARRIVAIYRMLLPQACIRTAGGRNLMPQGGRALFAGGANGAITGDLLTTAGPGIDQDKAMVLDMGFSLEAPKLPID